MRYYIIILSLITLSMNVIAQSDVLFDEISLTEARAEFGLTGKGAIVAVLDRGIDYRHADFIKEDGTSKILAIWDLSDDSGAEAANNPYGKGTIYDQASINNALSTGVKLATRDASGHGTVTAGVAAGDGSASNKGTEGVAPDADIIYVKFTSEGAPAHGSQAAEAGFYFPDYLDESIMFIKDVAAKAGKPVSMIGNFGSSGGPMDGTSGIARMLDAAVSEDTPGVAFICGSSDDGGLANHAQIDAASNSSYDLIISKTTPNLRLDLWYHETDAISFTISTPSSTEIVRSISTKSDAVNVSASDFVAYHRGSNVEFYNADNNKNELLIDFSGNPSPVDITVSINTESIGNGRIDASLNPSLIFNSNPNIFKTYVKEGYTVWDLASAKNNICPNSYIIRDDWTSASGGTFSYPGHENGVGSLWTGSGIGPTYDGRIGVDIAVPGNINFGAYAKDSYFALLSGNVVETGDNPYGVIAAVSGANPVLAGVVALMLEANPQLSGPEIKRILQKTARSDEFTGEVPNVTWGYGKLDVYAALEEVYNPTSVEQEITVAPAIEISPNPVVEYVEVELTGLEANQHQIAVYDLSGQEVLSKIRTSSNKHRIDLNNVDSGIYLITVRAQGHVFTKKLVKI